MAELNANPESAEHAAACCSSEAQASCCEPEAKSDCCGPAATVNGGCGCGASAAAGADADADAEDIRDIVRDRYAAAARALSDKADAGTALNSRDRQGSEVFGGALYESDDLDLGTATAVQASLGCGVPTAVADLHEGETVLDLGSGAGGDVLISARRVGTAGKAIGLDMTDEMLDLARENARKAGIQNVEFVKGYLEDLPLPDATVDVVISNCVINLSGDKTKVLAEAARVLKPGGRFAVSDVIADPGMDAATKADMQSWTGCIAGALTEQEFQTALADAGLERVEIHETHRVHEHAAAAIIRARKPAG